MIKIRPDLSGRNNARHQIYDGSEAGHRLVATRRNRPELPDYRKAILDLVPPFVRLLFMVLRDLPVRLRRNRRREPVLARQRTASRKRRLSAAVLPGEPRLPGSISLIRHHIRPGRIKPVSKQALTSTLYNIQCAQVKKMSVLAIESRASSSGNIRSGPFRSALRAPEDRKLHDFGQEIVEEFRSRAEREVKNEFYAASALIAPPRAYSSTAAKQMPVAAATDMRANLKKQAASLRPRD